jgi:hypothetical protein
VKLSDLAPALKRQAQLNFLNANRASVAAAVRVDMGNVALVLPADVDTKLSAQEIAVSAEDIGAIRNAILSVIDAEINRVKGKLAQIGVEIDVVAP